MRTYLAYWKTKKHMDDDNMAMTMREPVIGIRFSAFPSETTGSDVLTAFGGEERYDDYVNRLVHVYTAPETVQDMLMQVARKYLDEDYALAWFDRMDDAIAENPPSADRLDAYALMPPFTDAYRRIESEYHMRNRTEFEPKLERLKARFASDAGSADMANASDEDWLDALILNLDEPDMFGERWDSGRDGQAAREWHDIIDDLMLLYAATSVYVGIRAFGAVAAYAF